MSTAGKDQPLDEHAQHQTFCKKNETELETLIQIVRIYSQDKGMGLDRKMRHASNEKSQTTHDRRRIESSNHVVIRMLRDKETYKYLGILKADTIKQQE